MADGRHLKNVKSLYLLNRLNDFDEIWHTDRGHIVKIYNFSKTKMAAAAILKNHKNCDITASDWPIFAKFGTFCKTGLLSIQTVEKFEFLKSKMADGRHFKNR